MINTEIQNYRIVEKIGEGGMATVYKAVHKTIPGIVRAIKMMNPVLGSDDTIKSKFIVEASAMASLDHPYIVKIYDYVEQDGHLFLVMEYVEGHSLEDMIRKHTGPIPEDRAKKIFIKILEAIGYAHSKGIIHRDIKPSNILISTDDNPKIIDFGIVKILEDDHNPGKTKTGTRIGTPIYMSPEQILAKDVDKRCDIYALGVTLFQMITGRVPYDHTLSEFEIQTKIVNEALPRIKEIYPPASFYMQAIIDKASAKNRDARFQNCDEFAKALSNPNTVVSPPPGPVSPVNPPVRPTTVQPKKKSNTVWIILSIIFGSLVLLVLLIMFINKVVTNSEAKSQYNDGRQNIVLKKYPEAIDNFTKAINLKSDYQLAYRERARARYYSSQNEDALTDLNKAIEMDALDDTALNLRGSIYKVMERYDDALNDYNKAIRLDNRFTWAYYNRGNVKIAQGKYEASIPDFDYVISIDKNYTSAYTQRGYAKYNMKNYEAAIMDYDQSIRLDDNDELVFYRRALCKYILSKKVMAFDDLNKAIQIGDNSGYAYWLRGLIYSDYSDRSNACSDFHKSKTLGCDKGKEYYNTYCR